MINTSVALCFLASSEQCLYTPKFNIANQLIQHRVISRKCQYYWLIVPITAEFV